MKAFGPDGDLRHHAYSQEDAWFLFQRGLVIVTRWNRTRDRIICIQFLGDTLYPTKPQRWLKTGTRYSYPEIFANHAVWTHKPLPYRMVRSELDRPTIQQVNDALQSLFAGPLLSVVRKRNPAAVIVMQRRRRHAAPGTFISPERKAA